MKWRAMFALCALILGPAPAGAAQDDIRIVKHYTFGPAPTSLCKLDPAVGGACFDIPQSHRTFFVEASDSRGYHAHFRMILLDAKGIPIVSADTYGEHCGWIPFRIVAPPSARHLVVDIAETPSFMVSWCPHVSDDGTIAATFSENVPWD